MKSKIHELNYINKIDVSKTVILIFSTLLCVANASAQTIENEINKLSGKFAGEWAMYKLDENHETVKAMVWKDTLRTSKPIINDTLAYVNVNSVMVFDNPSIPSYKMNFIEGFKIKNRTIKSRFFEVRGTESVEIKISDNTYIVSQDITPFELKQLGIKSAIKATNTSNIAPTLTASFKPSVVPLAIASRKLAPIFSEAT